MNTPKTPPKKTEQAYDLIDRIDGESDDDIELDPVTMLPAKKPVPRQDRDSVTV